MALGNQQIVMNENSNDDQVVKEHGLFVVTS